MREKRNPRRVKISLIEKMYNKKKLKSGRAWVINGNKNYQHRVFAIKGARIIKSWDTDEYLKLSLSEIKAQLVVRNTHFRSTPF